MGVLGPPYGTTTGRPPRVRGNSMQRRIDIEIVGAMRRTLPLLTALLALAAAPASASEHGPRQGVRPRGADLQRVVRDPAPRRARRRHRDLAQRLRARAQRQRRRRQLRLPAAADVRHVRAPLRHARDGRLLLPAASLDARRRRRAPRPAGRGEGAGRARQAVRAVRPRRAARGRHGLDPGRRRRGRHARRSPRAGRSPPRSPRARRRPTPRSSTASPRRRCRCSCSTARSARRRRCAGPS